MMLHRLSRKAAFDLRRQGVRSQRCKLIELAQGIIKGHHQPLIRHSVLTFANQVLIYRNKLL